MPLLFGMPEGISDELESVLAAIQTWAGKAEEGLNALQAEGAPPVPPTGGMMPFGGDAQSVVPIGWLYCDGRQVSRTTYAALFAVIGTRWGSGDGSTTFNLPNGKDRFFIGRNTGLVGATGGSETHSHTVDNHTHGISGGVSANTAGADADANYDGAVVDVADRVHAHNNTLTTDAENPGTDSQNHLPPYMAGDWIIKT